MKQIPLKSKEWGVYYEPTGNFLEPKEGGNVAGLTNIKVWEQEILEDSLELCFPIWYPCATCDHLNLNLN